ncbi:MAG: DNA polymerase III subunit beta [Candidatus Melainabacteria bacterium GWF2_32_7]|nr:MAG: DNA polymerase III subunit beta [Candidatus Melainabacteria bacterium GWF2_32_7]
MLFTIQKENIYNALNAVIKATATRGIQPVLANVLIETIDSDQIKLCATDLDISIEVNIPAEIITTGSITLPAKKLVEIVTKLPNQPIKFDLNHENNLTEITCGKSKFDLIGISSSEFPTISHIESEDSIEIEIEPLLKAIKETVFAAATYDTNNVLSGIFFQVKNNLLEMAATDGNRLTRTVKNINSLDGKEYSIVIPARTLNEFSRILTGTSDEKVSITIKSAQISFKLTDRVLTSRLLEGQYPKYTQLIPSNYEILAKADKNLLIAALERTSTLVNERTSIIKLIFNDNQLELLAETPDLGDSSDQIDIDYAGDELKIAFNYKYILDTLKVLDSDNVKIELGTSLSPTLFKPDSDEDYLCLIMPVQIR